MKHILLPTDFSDDAYGASAYAFQLFSDTACRFYLMHTYAPAIYRAEYVIHHPGQVGFGDVYQTLAMNKLQEAKKKLGEKLQNPKHDMVLHTAFNTLVDEVQETVKNEGIDLIVMGTQGATGAKEIFLGTNTVHVMKKTKVPLLTIPPNTAFEKIKKILFPTDYEVDYTAEQLEIMKYIALEHDSSIEIMHVSTGYELTKEQQKNKARLKAIFNELPHRFHDWPSEEIITAINNFQSGHGAQLLAMIRNKHTFIERLFVEPVVKKIGFHTTIPFLIIPQEF